MGLKAISLLHLFLQAMNAQSKAKRKKINELGELVVCQTDRPETDFRFTLCKNPAAHFVIVSVL